MRIELYPTVKSCSMQCPGCNLSDNGGAKSNIMDPQVKTAFLLLQNIIRCNELSSILGYNLPEHASVDENLDIVNTDLFRQIGVAFGKMSHSSDYIDSTTQRIRDLFSGKQMITTTLKCIVTRPNPNIGSVEEIHQLYSSLCDRFDPMGIKGLHLGLEYNMENYNFFLEQISNLTKQQDQHHTYLESIYSGKEVTSSIDSDISDFYGAASWRARSFVSINSHRYGITSRYIARMHQDTLDTYRGRALSIVNRNSIFEESFSLYPHAILLNHSSIDLNNPFFWVSYEEFYNTIKSTDAAADLRKGVRALIGNNIAKIHQNSDTIPQDLQKLINPK